MEGQADRPLAGARAVGPQPVALGERVPQRRLAAQGVPRGVPKVGLDPPEPTPVVTLGTLAEQQQHRVGVDGDALRDPGRRRSSRALADPGPAARSRARRSGGSIASRKETMTSKRRSRDSMYTSCWASQRRSHSFHSTVSVAVGSVMGPSCWGWPASWPAPEHDRRPGAGD